MFNVTDSLFDETDEEKLAELKKTAADEMLAAAEKGDEAFISAAYEHASEDTKDSYTDDSYTLRTGGASQRVRSSPTGSLTPAARPATLPALSLTARTTLQSSSPANTHDYALPNVRHILISVTDTTDEDAMAEAKAKAEELLAQYEAGEHTEDAFAAIGDAARDDGTASRICPL